MLQRYNKKMTYASAHVIFLYFGRGLTNFLTHNVVNNAVLLDENLTVLDELHNLSLSLGVVNRGWHVACNSHFANTRYSAGVITGIFDAPKSLPLRVIITSAFAFKAA